MLHKPIRAVVEIGPNYIMHLLAVAKVGFDSEYSSRYTGTVKEVDLEYLRTQRSLLIFANGQMGQLTGLLIFLPCYLNLDSKTKLQEFFSLLLAGLREGQFQPFMDRYSEEIARLDFWIQPVDSHWLAQYAAHSEEIARLALVYADNFDVYLDQVWTQEAPHISAVAASINDHFRKTDIITLWETLTNRQFKFDYYEIVLCSAIENGPNANSLGYERNMFYSGHDFAFMTQFISHEVGTHILIDLIAPAFRGGMVYPFGLVYRTYENLAKFYNTRILGDTNAYDNMYGAFGEQAQLALHRLNAVNPSLSPDELFWQAVEGLWER